VVDVSPSAVARLLRVASFQDGQENAKATFADSTVRAARTEVMNHYGARRNLARYAIDIPHELHFTFPSAASVALTNLTSITCPLLSVVVQ
jgi:hypothetical protein